MATVLHIVASPRGKQSYSTTVARALLESYRDANPEDTIETLDLFSDEIPPFRTPEAKAKYRVLGGQEVAEDDEAARAWRPVIETIDRFKSADKVVVSSAMWNFSIPYRLKQYIDVIVQPGLTFSYSPESGYTGLVTGRPAVLVLARGGNYAEGTGFEDYDAQRSYLEQILGFMGFEDIRTVVIQPTLMGGEEAAGKSFAAAVEKANELGSRL